jgi:glycosyltransferase involved in cell wall biosynthesis
MKIVHVTRRFVKEEWGGVETVVLELSKQLVSKGIGAEIVCSNALAKNNFEVIDSIDVRRFSCFYPYLGLSKEAKHKLDKKAGNLFSFSLLNYLKNLKDVDLVHLHTGKRLGGIVRHVCLKKKIPYVVSVHGGILDVPLKEVESWTKPTQGAFEWGKVLGAWVGSRSVLKDADAVICLGEKEKASIKAQFPDKRVEYIPNGVNFQRFKNGDGPAFRKKWDIEKDAKILLCVGRIDEQKNQKFLIDLLPDLLKTHPDIMLVCIGHVTDKAYYENLEKLISDNSLGQYVRIIPGLAPDSSDLVDAYHAATIFLLPSRHEPFGVVALEAWAAKKPVIVSKIGGLPSFIEDNKNGLLLEVDNAEVWRKAILDILEHKSMAKVLAKQGYQKLEKNFGWAVVSEKILGIYQDLLEK